MLQLCQQPPQLSGSSADDLARDLYALYSLYGLCAGMHAELVRYLESPDTWSMK